MSDTPSTDQSKGEVPLADIDNLLEEADPGFTKQLEEVRSVETDRNVEIEATVTEEGLSSDENLDEKPESGWRRWRARLRAKWFAFRMRLKNRLIVAAKDLLVFLKTRPKDFALYAFAMAKIAARRILIPWQAFRLASRAEKFTILLLVGLGTGCAWMLWANLKGIWIPSLNKPVLSSFEDYADSVETFDPKIPGESFYSAFPQERHEFLFPKMKVNLKRTAENPLPMGAFEIIVLVDSKDTAIEVRDREVELFDFLQRVFEEETFTSLETELGKNRLKGRIKRELNDKLTQGWVKAVNFKTFILKP
ncbi:MAG: flagellar basal body-associated protein FliL [Bdellovibrionales bacterium]